MTVNFPSIVEVPNPLYDANDPSRGTETEIQITPVDGSVIKLATIILGHQIAGAWDADVTVFGDKVDTMFRRKPVPTP